MLRQVSHIKINEISVFPHEFTLYRDQIDQAPLYLSFRIVRIKIGYSVLNICVICIIILRINNKK